jgi:uncharacterized protein YjgD (DUF1641 family)
MATPISFKPEPVDPREELMRQIREAPREHAEALLVAWDTLQVAHDQGILELVKGLMGGRDIIATKVAEGINTPEGVTAIRNGIALARVLGSLDPDMLHRLSKHLDDAAKGHKQEQQEEKPPSLWQLFRRLTSDDARRGLSYATWMIAALGRATRPNRVERALAKKVS